MVTKTKPGWRIPAYILVGGQAIAIRREEIPDDQCMFGYYQKLGHGSVIVIDSRLEGARELSTYLHEMCHAIDEIFGIGLSHKQVNGLGEGLAQALSTTLQDKPRKSRKRSGSGRK